MKVLILAGCFGTRLSEETQNIPKPMVPVRLLAIVFLNPLLMGLGSLFFVLKAAENSFHLSAINSLLAHKYALYIGRISYGLYVYHIMVIYYATPYIFNPLWHQINWDAFGRWGVIQYHSWLVKLPLYSAITIGIAELSYRYMEQPLLKLKDRYFKHA